jgi:ariadne-1
MSSAGCGHRFCHECWRGFVAAAFGDGARCLALRCPAASCRRAVLRGTFERFSTGDYGRLLLRSYVDAPGTGLRPCPAPGCGCAVKVYAAAVRDVLCQCGRGFCLRCGGAAHWPASCGAVERWARDADAASAAWLLVHAKPCPQCRRPIGRPDDGGYGSIVCAPPCSYRFCWRCLSPMDDPHRPRVSHYDCPELYAPEQEAEEDEE